MGLCIALALQGRGVAVTLLDAGLPQPAASWGNAGHVAIEQVDPLASPANIKKLPQRLFSLGGGVSFPPRAVGAWLPFGLRLLRASSHKRFSAGRHLLEGLMCEALPAWRRLTADMGRPDILREEGHFVAWESAKSAAAGRRHWQARCPSTIGLADTSEAELRQLRALSNNHIHDAIRFDGTAQIADPWQLRAALENHFQAKGGKMICRHVDDTRQIDTDYIVIAAGAASKSLLARYGLHAPLIAERGYHIACESRDWPCDMPPLVFEDRSIIVTRFASELRVAGFVEFTRSDTPPDPEKWIRLERHMAELGIVASQWKRWYGARPTLPDYLPAIGRSAETPKLFYAIGHQHLGLTLAPLTGEVIAATICGDETGSSLPDALSLARFV